MRCPLKEMAPYSVDLRRKIVLAYERGLGSQREVAEFFGVSLAFVEKLLAQWRRTGNLAPKPHAGGKPTRLSDPVQDSLRHWLGEQSDLTLAELAGRVERTYSFCVDLPQLCRWLQKLGLPRKKRRFMPRSVIGPR